MYSAQKWYVTAYSYHGCDFYFPLTFSKSKHDIVIFVHLILKKPHCCFTLQKKKKKKEGVRGHEAPNRGRKAPRWKEQHARRPGVRGAGVVGRLAASRLEALAGSTVLAQRKCSLFVLSQWHGSQLGFVCQRGGSNPAGLATGHHPAAPAQAGRNSIPGSPHSLQLAAPALVSCPSLPHPPSSCFFGGVCPFRDSSPNQLGSQHRLVSPGASHGVRVI